ncbi:MAG: UvrB/UvrC motif-containing protein [candidate division WOR-3 bacterium]|nr:UvrB/UvrC motif-containing protein [candidate division WOR-3 bacterium]MCX7836682.1 UvrB/UvrC motif-containing protein [candidate division WOR-3 bacterium]MDW8113677.1 UvrB/UvrC motif-containing protein [candidate division WOR-3 bacterium]
MEENLCQLCQKNIAIMVITEMDEKGNKREIAICEECAKKRGVLESGKTLNIEEILKIMLKAKEKEDKELKCPRCLLTFYEFKKYGKFGCPDCFKAFEEKLIPFIKKIQTTIREKEEEVFHKGKKVTVGVKRSLLLSEIKRLKMELEKAIREEDYEQAAKIRDMLKEKEEELKKDEIG